MRSELLLAALGEEDNGAEREAYLAQRLQSRRARESHYLTLYRVNKMFFDNSQSVNSQTANSQNSHVFCTC